MLPSVVLRVAQPQEGRGQREGQGEGEAGWWGRRRRRERHRAPLRVGRGPLLRLPAVRPRPGKSCRCLSCSDRVVRIHNNRAQQLCSTPPQSKHPKLPTGADQGGQEQRRGADHPPGVGPQGFPLLVPRRPPRAPRRRRRRRRGQAQAAADHGAPGPAEGEDSGLHPPAAVPRRAHFCTPRCRPDRQLRGRAGM